MHALNLRVHCPGESTAPETAAVRARRAGGSLGPMQQTPQIPQPTQPAVGRAQAGGADAPVPGVPQTRAQLDAMMQRRSELREQLQALGRRRNQLDEQRHATAQPGRAAIEARIAEVDARMARIDQQIMQADDAIAEAIARGVQNVQGPAFEFVTAVPPPPPAPGPGPADGERIAALFVGQALLFLVVGTVMYRRLKRRLRPGAAEGADRARLDQLQQAVDVIAVEVERIAEGQRFVAKALNEKLHIGGGDAQPVATSVRSPEPVARNKG